MGTGSKWTTLLYSEVDGFCLVGMLLGKTQPLDLYFDQIIHYICKPGIYSCMLHKGTGKSVNVKGTPNFITQTHNAEKAMAPHSSTLAWKIPWAEEPGRAIAHGVAKSQTWLSDFTFTFHFHALEKEMATHSSVLAWRIPGTGEPGGLPPMESHRVRHDWSNLAAAAAGL